MHLAAGDVAATHSDAARLHFGRRRLPMLLCCKNSDSSDAACHTDKTLRLFHAAGAAMAMRIYAGCNQLSKSVLCDVNRWIMEEVCGPSFAMRSTCKQ